MKIVKEANTEKKFVRDVTGNTVLKPCLTLPGHLFLLMNHLRSKQIMKMFFVSILRNVCLRH